MSDDQSKDLSTTKTFRSLDDLKSSRPLDTRPLETKPVHVGPETVVVPGPPKETAKDKADK